MKTLSVLLLSALFFILPARCATITWTNTAGGYWSDATNWSPNLVPGAADTAVLPSAASNGAALDMTVTLQNLILNGGVLGTTEYSYDTLTVSGEINWTNGTLGCVVTNNGVTTLAGGDGVNYSLLAFFYNAGTFNLLSGNLLVNYCGANSGGFENASNALVDFQGDSSIDVSSNQFGLCSPPFSNEGVIRKSGGSGTSFLYVPADNSGILDAQSGTLSLNGGGTVNGTLQSEGTGAFVLASNIYGNAPLILNGNLAATNAFLEGANLVGNGTISGVLTWVSGSLVSGSSGLIVEPTGVLVLAGTNGGDYSLNAALYNLGTVKLVSGNLLINYCGSAFGELINDPTGLVDIQNDVAVVSTCGGEIVNQGTFRKSGGTGTSDIGAYLNNSSGLIDAQSGVIALTNNYDLTDGSVNIGVNSLTSYGHISLAGTSPLSGALNLDLNNGYIPANGNAFPIMTYTTDSGTFNPLNIPPWINWQTNYGPTSLTLTVVNLQGQPVLAAPVIPPSGQLTFQFAGNPKASYSVLAATNLLVPLTNWTVIGSATLVSNDLFQFVDTQPRTNSERFYRLSSQ
ncbi:MAG TPA: hypothetical protein VH619_14690 [Verrucomicrobiae bacterium]|nr:hypothetical protein [Verrucomicrobiae bacterium]